MRTIAIWFVGLTFFATFGGMLGALLMVGDIKGRGGGYGALTGMLVFACLKIWLGAILRRRKRAGPSN
jgi:hypothetical protein